MGLSPIQQEESASSCLSMKTKNSTQAEGGRGFWSEFPEDLVFEVLSMLPKKDLITSKFVSKDWNFVISRVCIPRLCPPCPRAPFWALLCFKDPLPPPDSEEQPGDDHPNNNPSSGDKLLKLHFIRLYNYMYGELFPPRFLQYRREDYFLSLLPKELEEECDPSHIQDCCNGLLLITSSTSSRYYLANPVTKQRLLIPDNSHRHSHTSIKNIRSSLIFDPSLSLGFKIISCIRPAEHATATLPMELDIFCSEAGQWSSHVLPLDPHGLYGFEWLRRSVYFDRALYSLSLAMYLVSLDNLIPDPSRVTSSMSKDYGGFDVEAWAIELPDKDLIPSVLLPHFSGCIGVSSGSLYYSNRDVEGSSMSVWMLVSRGRNSEWALIHTISIADDLVSSFRRLKQLTHWKKFDCFRPRAFLPKDDAMIIAAPGLVIAYYLKTKVVHELWFPPTPWNCNRKTLQLNGNWIFPFSPCLLLLNNTAA
ncbi:OLC1v1012117C1 [Oldenlandia corymbosa var. corymbosa]|uniref:OLC1v1012117C1 n=1 Tax=Oldenlandia corymbosa var. corymbosa TaxID=529605 RepID=A0AAV1DYL4_OLDCO|nr:OLC1v1012117C1 [Oldenlandia corymbosa var. corymbosa]